MKPNILFIVLDGFRADKCFGENKTSVTPNIDSLIRNGVNFKNTIVSGQSSTPSVSSILTSKYPFECLIQDDGIFRLNPKIPTHIQKLKENGYKTFGIIQDSLLHIGFEEIFEKEEINGYDHEKMKLWSGLGESILKKINFIEENKPWFFYIQLYDLNLLIYPENYRKKQGPENFNNLKYGKNKYEQIISAQDFWIGEILKKINFKNTLVVFTSDHGLESGAFNDKLQKFDDEQRSIREFVPGAGFKIAKKVKFAIPFRKKIAKKYSERIQKIKKERVGPEKNKLNDANISKYEKRLMEFIVWPTSNIFEDRIHVPLIMSGLNLPKNKEITKLVGSKDIFPTVFDICKLTKILENNRGKSLLPIIKEEEFFEEPIFLESTVNVVKSSDSNVIGLRTDKFKYFRDKDNSLKNINLFNLELDPFEENNIAEDNPSLIEKFENEILVLNEERDFNIPKIQNIIDSKNARTIEEKLKKAGYIN